jgi:hypothetical protein
MNSSKHTRNNTPTDQSSSNLSSSPKSSKKSARSRSRASSSRGNKKQPIGKSLFFNNQDDEEYFESSSEELSSFYCSINNSDVGEPPLLNNISFSSKRGSSFRSKQSLKSQEAVENSPIMKREMSKLFRISCASTFQPRFDQN